MNAELAHELRDVAVAAQGDLVIMVESFHKPGADIASVLDPVGHGVHFELASIVQLDELDDLPAGRMTLQGGRKIGDLELAGRSRNLGRSDGDERNDPRHPELPVAARIAQMIGGSDG